MTNYIKLIVNNENKKGDIFSHEMSGGGGYGEPIEREESLVLKDIIEEKVDIKIAESEYGVAVIEDNFGNLIITKKQWQKQIQLVPKLLDMHLFL